ncbi:hypothetical protein CASFOL_026871 [Castilleja foliolosa]|uniref:Uncharacterized protein n=1 Tax=Castilleja foliolosa TaxID=1961234 RepID=A0ABD3CK50_9LAMI
MVNTYTSLQDSIASICKTILPFSFKKRQRLPAIAAAEQRLSKQQSDNLKWQQDSFHQILNLMGLAKEGIVSENEVSAFRSHLLETLITSPIDYEPPVILRDKLIFLQSDLANSVFVSDGFFVQFDVLLSAKKNPFFIMGFWQDCEFVASELLYAKCISEEEYHASKRPLLQRLAVQGAEIDARDVVIGAQNETSNNEWSVIDLKDDKCLANQHISTSKKNAKENSTVKQRMKGAASVFGLVSPDKNRKLKENKVDKGLDCSTENPFWNGHLDEKESETKTILMVESLPSAHVDSDKSKKKQVTAVYESEKNPEKEKPIKFMKKTWGFDGFKKWKKNDSDDERALLTVDEKSSGVASYGGKLVANPVAEGPDTKQIKRKLHPNGSPSDFFVDKVLGEKIKKGLCRYPNVHLSDDQIEVISTRLPVDKADLTKLFPKSWCDEYGDIVLDVVRKEFKEHMREMGQSRSKAVEKPQNDVFDDENLHPNLFAPLQEQSGCVKRQCFSSTDNIRGSVINSSIDKGFKYNPFFDM